MKKIYLIFILACLTEQLKADVYTIRPVELNRDGEPLTDVNYIEKTVIFCDDVNQGDTKIDLMITDEFLNYISQTKLDDPCNMDPSTEEGLLAAIFWRSLDIDSCPVAAGKYSLAGTFDQTGMLKDKFERVTDKIALFFKLKSQEGQQYLALHVTMTLQKVDSSS